MNDRARSNLGGVAVMIVAVGALSLMDACLKLLSPHYPALEIASLRGWSTLPFILVWIATTRAVRSLVRVRLPLHLLRGGISILMLSLFTYGVRGLPLADAYSIFFVAPLLITVLAVPLLREHVDRRRWIAIGVGFAGVLIVLRPTTSSAMTLPGLAILVTALGYAFSAITVRVLGRTDSTQAMVFWLMTIVAVGAGLLAWPSWQPVRPEHWRIVAALGALGALGQWAITEAFRRGEASFLAPFEYTALVWGVGLDWFVWNTAPTLVPMLGATVIVGSGVYLVRHERVHLEAEHP